VKKIETRHFNVNYSEKDEYIVEQISKLIDDTYENIIHSFDLSGDVEKFEFILCPDVTTFIEKTGKTAEQYQEWMVGNADYIQRKVCILSPNAVTDRSFEEMLAVIKHEVIHVAFDQLQNADEADIMIAEGIAVALAEQIDVQFINDKEYPDVRKLSEEEYFYENDGYLFSGVYILHLLRRCGNEKFKKIYAGEESIETYLYEGFEIDAIRELFSATNLLTDNH
jgi:hypothetical protein